MSTSIAALTLVAVANVLGLPNPLNPMQILWINIIMDGPPAQSLGVESVDPAIMQRPPRRRSEGVITQPLLARSITSGLFIFMGTTYIFWSSYDFNSIDPLDSRRALTITFTAFVCFDLFNALACRHNSRPFYEFLWDSNSAFVVAVVLSIIGQLFVVYCPPLQKVFRTVALSLSEVLYIIFFTSGMLTLDTVRKVLFPQYFADGVQPVSIGSLTWQEVLLKFGVPRSLIRFLINQLNIKKTDGNTADTLDDTESLIHRV